MPVIRDGNQAGASAVKYLSAIIPGPVFVVGLVALLTCVTASLILTIVPEASFPAVAESARQLLFDIGAIRPEPRERAAYIGTLFVLPGIIWIAVRAGRRLTGSSTRIPAWLIIALVSAASCLVWADPYWNGFLSKVIAPSQLPVLILATVIGTLLVTAMHSQKFGDSILKPVFWGVCLIAAVLTGSWQIMGSHSLSNLADYVHYDAVAYSVAQITNGGTCLAMVTPQYGCYGEFIAPFIRLFSDATLGTTMVFSLLLVVALLIMAVTSRQLISRPLLAIAAIVWLLPVINRVWIPASDPNFQNMPVRLLFPALSLLAVLIWQRRPSVLAALKLGVFSGLALIWNLDTGAVTLLALLICVAFSGMTESTWNRRQLGRQLCSSSLVAIAASLTVVSVFFGLSAKAGAFLALGNYLIFQGTFVASGANMLPMPALPALWGLWVFVAGVAIVIAALGIRRGRDDRAEFAAYLALLGLGLFSYYNGRSHPQVLALVSWPFIILAFHLADRALDLPAMRNSPANWFGHVATAFVCSIGLVSMGVTAPRIWSLAAQHWNQFWGTQPPGDVALQVDYIRSHTQPGDASTILAYNQAALYAETGLRALGSSMSWIEILRRSDADAQIQVLLDRKQSQVFMGFGLCCEAQPRAFSTWLAAAMPQIKQTFSLAGWDQSGNLMRLTPRNGHTDQTDLFRETVLPHYGDNGYFLTGLDRKTGDATENWARPVVFPKVWPIALGRNFMLSIGFSRQPVQKSLVTIVSTSIANGQGFSIEMDEGGMARLYLGNGTGWNISEPFQLSADVDHSIMLRVAQGSAALLVDGVTVHEANLSYVPGAGRLITGGYPSPGRELAGKLSNLTVKGEIHAP